MANIKGKRRSPEQRSEDNIARVEANINRLWRKYLEEHPAFALEIAQHRFVIAVKARTDE